MQPPASGLDLRAILSGVTPVTWFVAMAVLATVAGYPGVVCITPMAWLLGLSAGQRVAAVSSSPPGRRVVVEAGIAGALVGLIEGVLFVLVGSRAELSGAEEVQQMLAFSACIVLLGIPVTAGLAMALAWMVERRRAREEAGK